MANNEISAFDFFGDEIEIVDAKVREDIKTLNTQFEKIANQIEQGGIGGEKGDDGIGIKSVTQTTTSTEDGGSNVITVTKTDNTTSTFIIKNGSKGSKGDKGEDGKSVTVSNITESTADGGNNVVTFSDGKTITIKNGSKGGNGTETNSVPTFYKTEFLGDLYEPPGDNNYIAWCPGDLRYDKKIDKYIMLAYCCDKHVSATIKETYQIVINPYTFETTKPVKIKFLDSDGNTDITPVNFGVCSYIILKDDTYLMIKNIDNVYYKFVSTDNGVTWIKQSVATGFSDNPWNIFELQNGRLIATIDVANKGIYYSDDKGVTWTNVKPSGTPGAYNAEGCILELGNNNLMCIARKNMNGSGGYDPNGTNYSGASDHAIISYSTDNGSTWSAWVESTSIDNMNASCCTGIVHDGVIDLFACSRWYYTNETYVNSDYTNTGKCGAITHYTATIENALNDNFTNNGIIVYSNADPSVKQSSMDFHSPCVTFDKNNDMLLVYFDRRGNGIEEKTNHYFIRGSLKGLSYKTVNNFSSKIFAYSGYKIDNKLNSLEARLIQKVNDAINNGSTITPDVPGVYIYTSDDSLIVDFDLLDESKCDTTAMSIIDKKNSLSAHYRVMGDVRKDLVSTFPDILDGHYRSSNNHNDVYFVFDKNQLTGKLDLNQTFCFETSVFFDNTDSDVFFIIFFNNGAGSFRIFNYAQPMYTNTEGSNVYIKKPLSLKPYLNNFFHMFAQFNPDGSYKFWFNNVLCVEEPAPTDFVSWDERILTNEFSSNQNLISMRFYNRELTDEERTNNYMYEKTRYES